MIIRHLDYQETDQVIHIIKFYYTLSTAHRLIDLITHHLTQ